MQVGVFAQTLAHARRKVAAVARRIIGERIFFDVVRTYKVWGCAKARQIGIDRQESVDVSCQAQVCVCLFDPLRQRHAPLVLDLEARIIVVLTDDGIEAGALVVRRDVQAEGARVIE
ncbi:MAG: hypothetical protein R2851_21005 [Caldilineaceae bacterium]